MNRIINKGKKRQPTSLSYIASQDDDELSNEFKKMSLMEELQRKTKRSKLLDSSEFKILEENEPLLDGNKYQKTDICPSIRIGKRTSFVNYDEYCFKEFSNNSFPYNEDEDEIKKQVNILKELNNSHIIRFFGVAQEDSKLYLVTEWMEYGNLNQYYTNYQDNMNWETKIRFAFDICRGVAYLHERMILHHDIQSANILVNENCKAKIANFGQSKRFFDNARNISHNLENIRYMAPEKLLLDNEEVPYDSKCEIYSVGVLLWEIAELKKPYYDLSSELLVNIRKRVKENYVLPFLDDAPNEWKYTVSKAMEYEPTWRLKISDICRDFYNLSKKDSGQNVSPTSNEYSSQILDEIEPIEPSLNSEQQLIRQFKLNHGLFLDGYQIVPSKQAVFVEDGELNISLYTGQPLVYTFINNRSSRSSHKNLLSFKSDDNIELNEALQPSDICINFPVAEITYNANLLESFSNCMGDGETLYEMYGHLFARRILIGGKLFIDDFKSATSDFYKSLIVWVYNSAKYKAEKPFNNLSAMNYFPKIRTSSGKNLNTPEKLINWMHNLYQKNIAGIISYDNLIHISELKLNNFSIDDSLKIQPEVANFEEELKLEEWVRDSIYANLTSWVKEFHLLQGLIINKPVKLEISKNVAINFINVPKVVSSDKYYLEMIKPTTNLAEILISNYIFSAEDISSLPFIRKSDCLSYGNYNYTHFLVKYERFKILLTKDDIKPSEKFKQAIEKALKSMKPFIYLQDVFNEYGHFYPLSIVLGKSLKNILQNSSIPNYSKKIDLESPTFESLESHLSDFDISYLLTQKGNIIEKNDLPTWIQNTNNDLEIIEYSNIISLYNILELEQQREIDIILNTQDNFNVIMTGIVDLKDLDINNTKHYKRINVECSLEDVNYKVFGSIISKDNLKLDDYLVTFGLYDFNGFFAIVNKLVETNVNINGFYILWMIIGNPLKLSVFSPKNRKLKVDCTEESITSQPDNSYYLIKASRQLSHGDTISINACYNYEPVNIKLIGWSKNCIKFQLTEPICIGPNLNNSNTIDDQFDDPLTNTETDIIVHICILSSNGLSLKIDNKEKEYYLDLIGYTLTEVNFNEDEDSMKADDLGITNRDMENLETLEPLLNVNQYQKTYIFSSKRIEKRTLCNNFDEFCFKEYNFSSLEQSNIEQILIRRQVSILKELKKSDHIIRFFGIVQEGSKYYFVTEWMEYGNLYEYYSNYKDNMNWKTKVKFALDICRGVAHLHGREILHCDIQSANILVNENRKVKLANFDLSKKFLEVTKNIPYNLENIRYMAPEKLLLDHEVPYNSECEIYSVGALLWEIGELKKPHYDISTELLVNIRKRVKENDILPFSNDAPNEWKFVVSKAIEYKPECRVKISDICHELYKLNSINSLPMQVSNNPFIDDFFNGAIFV